MYQPLDFSDDEPTASPPPANIYHDPELKAFVNEIGDLVQEAIATGNRWTLLKHKGNDYKLPVWNGWNDPATNTWGPSKFIEQIKYLIGENIELTGFGFVCGTMSGHRHALDFDRGDYLDRVRERVLAETGFDLNTLPRVKSGRTSTPGYHVIFRSTRSFDSQGLANFLHPDGRAGVIVELVGQGKQHVGPGSKHKSGNRYVTECGDPFNPPVVPEETVEKILSVIKTFDEVPPKPEPIRREPRPVTTYQHKPGESSEEIIERFNTENSIEETLQRYGYYESKHKADFYCHPTDSGDSVHLLDGNRAYHFGTCDPYGTGKTSTPFSLYARFEHGGNGSAAVKEVASRFGVGFKAVDLSSWVASSAAEPDFMADQGHPRKPELEIDLAELPPLIGEAVAALHQENPSLPAACNLMPVMAAAGVLMGKMATVSNLGQKYYPNLWTAILCPTGTNKSGTKNLIHQSLQGTGGVLPNKPTFTALYYELGKVIEKKEWSRYDIDQKAAAKLDAMRVCQQATRGRVFISDECTGMLKRLMGAWNAKAPANDLEDVLNLSDPLYPFESPTGTDGYRGMYDLCVSFIGFTQNDTWEREMASTHLKDVGMFGRFIPVTSGVRLVNIPQKPRPWPDLMAKVMELAQSLNCQVNCTFGVNTAEQVDPIREDMERLASSDVGKYLAHAFPTDWARLKGKIIGHAIKLAMICEFLSGKLVGRDDFDLLHTRPPHDCRRWFLSCAMLVAKCYLAYLDTADDCRRLSPVEQKLVEQLGRHEYLIERDLQRASRLYGSAFNALATSMLDAGIIGVLTRKSDPEKYGAALAKIGKAKNCVAPVYYRVAA